MQDKNEFHFFASSIATWGTTNEERDLLELLEIFRKEGFPFSLFKVPGPWTADYAIRFYAPQVEGAELLGTFEPKRKKKRAQAKEQEILAQVLTGQQTIPA